MRPKLHDRTLKKSSTGVAYGIYENSVINARKSDNNWLIFKSKIKFEIKSIIVSE